ncbi:hypothetical protein [uncultured Pontibacter sp.]|uniref:hypothetical protein n=1 Tax=uncultured Pontibacter sp. TaxID=453356 RepID=UPI0026253698|nr:hypothetical protein [uncultured Pontibacter sp.]
MKSILKLFLFMGIILLSKLTKESEIATATVKTGSVKSSFTNFKQQPDQLSESEENKETFNEAITKNRGM